MRRVPSAALTQLNEVSNGALLSELVNLSCASNRRGSAGTAQKEENIP